MSVIDEIASERQRQIDVEGWTLAHDDEHCAGELAKAASAYATHAALFRDALELGSDYIIKAAPALWPWERQFWNPKSPRRDLIRAAALIVAEVERLDRAALAKALPESER